MLVIIVRNKKLMEEDIKRMRKRIYDMKWGTRFGSDYVIHATRIDPDDE